MDSPEIVQARLLANEFGRDHLADLAVTLFGEGAKRPADPENKDNWVKLTMFPNLLESIGVMTLDRALPPRMVYQMWGEVIIRAGDQWAACIDALGGRTDVSIYQYFTWLVGKMREEEAKERERRLRDNPHPAWFA